MTNHERDLRDIINESMLNLVRDVQHYLPRQSRSKVSRGRAPSETVVDSGVHIADTLLIIIMIVTIMMIIMMMIIMMMMMTCW